MQPLTTMMILGKYHGHDDGDDDDDDDDDDVKMT